MLMAAMLLLIGCSVTLVAPRNVQDPVAVYILEYGRHPALVLPRSETELVEYSYGEWEWYARNRTGLPDVFRAVFLKSQGTLARRALAMPAREEQWREMVSIDDLHCIMVERQLVEDLLAQLDEQWESARNQAVYNPVHGLDMVPARRRSVC